MILRNSLKSTLRSTGKTALFTLLLFALTLVLALGVSVWASVAQFLRDCDTYYTTIGLVEYMGTTYPDDTAADPGMAASLPTFDAAAISADPAALSWEAPARALGYVPGFWRSDTFNPARMYSVVVVGSVYYDPSHGLYSGVVAESLYSLKSEPNTILYIDNEFGDFEKGHFYLLFGEVYHGRSPLLHLKLVNFENTLAAADGISVPGKIDITDAAAAHGYTIPADSVLRQVAATLRVTNNSLLINATDNLMALLPFQQQELYFVEGRPFTAEEYAAGARVIVISDLAAARLGVGVGAVLDLSAAVSNQPGVYNSYWAPQGFDFQAPFTVVGITNTISDKSWYVYVPRGAGVPASPLPIGFTVGQAVVRNADAAAFYAAVVPQLGDRFHLTMYDQGYAAVATPYRTILKVAKIVTGVCALVELSVVLLFGFLFVYRQRETSQTMLMLGAGRLRVVAHYLFSAALIALAAAAAGAAAAYALYHRIITLVVRFSKAFALVDARYSDGNLTIARTLEFAPQLPWHLFVMVGAAIFAMVLLSCLGFILGSFVRSRPSQRKLWGPGKARRSSRLSGTGFKYALLSITRGGARSSVIPVLALAMVLFLGQLATTALRYQHQLEAIYDNTTVVGYFTDINGKQIGNQVISAYNVDTLAHSGLVTGLSTSVSEPYYFLGISGRADGTRLEVPPLYVPDSLFARESQEAEILRGASLTAANDINTSPEFFYSEGARITFLEGFDPSILAAPIVEGSESYAIVPVTLMEARGIALGDTIRVAVNWPFRDPATNRYIYYQFSLRVVGSYHRQGASDTIYTPLATLFYTPLIWQDGLASLDAPLRTFDDGYAIGPDFERYLQNTTLNSANFRLVDSRDTVAFKDYLQTYGYSQVQQVGSVRQFVVLQDAGFNNAIASVRQQIRYINVLYPVLWVLVGIIAVVVSYLFVASRKQEFATMRGLGATRWVTFRSFFLEQLLLCLLGVGAGFGAWRLLWGVPTGLHLLLAGGFVACYILGCTASIMLMNRTTVLSILLDRD